MPDSDEDLPSSSSDSQSTESRMRRALGLQGPSRNAPQQRADQARPRHRFVQDGGVPVVVLNGRTDADPAASFRARIAELDAALEAERHAHGLTRRSLQELHTSVQSLQTRLVHTELAHRDAMAAERRLRKEIEDAMQPGPDSQAKPPSANLGTLPRAIAADQPKMERKTRRAGRPAKSAEPQPVKWWLPGYREKAQ